MAIMHKVADERFLILHKRKTYIKIRHITRNVVPDFINLILVYLNCLNSDYLQASSTATATATVIPTLGLLPAPIKPIISTDTCHAARESLIRCDLITFQG